jgi:peroxiredoxin Q/BCP
MLKVPDVLVAGSVAPDFTLPDQEGTKHTLSQYRGQWVLLYFYPKDDTPGCTKEACMIRDSFPDFRALDIVVLGVSVDGVASHKKFAQKYELPFILLADEEKTVVNLYHVWAKKKFLGREYLGTLRMSFLIDPTGVIAKVYDNVKPAVHAAEVLADIRVRR